MSKSTTTAKSGIGIGGLCFLWGIVTQCLNWAGVVNWPWEAIWGPFLFFIGILLVWLVVGIIIFLIVRNR